MNNQEYHNGRPTKNRSPVNNKNGENRSVKPSGAVVSVSGRALAKREKEKNWENGIVRVKRGMDRPMLAIILILLVLGTVMVFSASFPSAYLDKGDSMHYLKRQLLFGTLGCALMIGLSFIPCNFYRKMSPPVYIVSILLLLVVLLIGTSEGVAKRWIALGSITFQPSEFAKAAVIMMLAWYFDRNYEKLSKRDSLKTTVWQGVCIPGVILGIICFLVLMEKHLSGTIIIALISVCVVFLGGAHIGWTAGIYGAVGVLGIGAYLLTNPYALQRILTHADEDADALAEAWQTTQGVYAIGSGGLLGKGLGDSWLKYNYVSQPQNDFIFTIWCEEMGLVGAIIVIALYAAFVWRGFAIAKKAPDTYTSLVAFGITCQVGIQAFLNMMVVTDLIPNTGISLPFFSYGGSSLIILMCEMGILLSVSRHSYQKK